MRMALNLNDGRAVFAVQKTNGFSGMRNARAFFDSCVKKRTAALLPFKQQGGDFKRDTKESLIDSVIHADDIFLRPAASQKPRNSAAIPSVSFLAGRKNLLVIAKTS